MARDEISLGVDADTRDAVSDLDVVEEKARALERDPYEVEVGTDTTAAQVGLGKFKDSADDADASVRKLGGTSDQSRSVLANLVGNSAQDLGQFSGVAGTAGVAVGQLAEYAADGNIALGGLAKTAGPMLAIGAAVGFITSKLSAARQRAEDTARAARSIAEALREGDAAEAAKALAEQYGNLFDKASELGISERALADALAGNTQTLDEHAAAAQREVDALRTNTQMYDAAEASAINHGLAVVDLADDVHGAREAVEEETETLDRNAAMQEALTGAIARTDDATVAAEEAFRSYSAALEQESSFLSAQGDADALAGSLEEVARLEREGKAGTEEYADAQRAAAQDTNALKQTVLELVEQYGTIPDEERTRILAELPAAQQAAFDTWLRSVEEGATAPIAVVPDEAAIERARRRLNQAFGGWGFSSSPAPGASSSAVSVTIHAPAGTTPDAMVAAAGRYARRNGGTVLMRGRRR